MIKLHGFRLKHLLTWQIYYFFYAAIRFKLTGKQGFIYNKETGSFIKIGSLYIVSAEEWFVYRVTSIGHLFGVSIFHYEKR